MSFEILIRAPGSLNSLPLANSFKERPCLPAAQRANPACYKTTETMPCLVGQKCSFCFLKDLLILFYVCKYFCLQGYLCTTRVHLLWRPEEGVRSCGTGVTDSCEPPCGCWESNSSPLQKQSVLLMSSHLASPSSVTVAVTTVLWSYKTHLIAR